MFNWRRWLISGGAAALVGAAGCNEGGGPAVVEGPASMDPPPISIPHDSGSAAPAPLDAKMHQPFDQACIIEIDANAGIDLPPAQTIAGKHTGLLNDQVHKIWDSIKFVDNDGKPITYVASVHIAQGSLDLGTIEILMQPDWAPNHVRNFVALTTLRYYDGLRFDRIIRQQGDNGGPGNRLVLLEAGAPTDEADPATSHLGYWLKPEFSESVKHEEGVVGACLLESEDNAETAAVRFYISLTPAPAMDGNFTVFGKVIQGLDLAKRLSETPVLSTNPGPRYGRPAQPISIKQVQVRALPVQ